MLVTKVHVSADIWVPNLLFKETGVRNLSQEKGTNLFKSYFITIIEKEES